MGEYGGGALLRIIKHPALLYVQEAYIISYYVKWVKTSRTYIITGSLGETEGECVSRCQRGCVICRKTIACN